MDISAINRNIGAQLAPAPAAPAEKAAETRDIVQAVKALNAAGMFGQDNQLMFERDPATQRMVIRMVDRNTGEVISQIPAEYVLRLAESMKHSNP